MSLDIEQTLVSAGVAALAYFGSKFLDSNERRIDTRLKALEEVSKETAQHVQDLRRNEARFAERDVFLQATIAQLTQTMSDMSSKVQSIILGQTRLETRMDTILRGKISESEGE